MDERQERDVVERVLEAAVHVAEAKRDVRRLRELVDELDRSLSALEDRLEEVEAR